MPAKKVILNGNTIMDVTDTTAVASDVAQGKYFYDADGVKTVGTASGGGETNKLPAFVDGSLTTITAEDLAGATQFRGFLCYGFYPDLEAISMPDTVLSIGDMAFEMCEGLTSVDLGNGLTTLGEAVFEGCTALESIELPASIEEIGGSCFAGCSNLTSITVRATTPPTLADQLYYGTDGISPTIYVPASSVSAYQSATNWSQYANQIQAIVE